METAEEAAKDTIWARWNDLRGRPGGRALPRPAHAQRLAGPEQLPAPRHASRSRGGGEGRAAEERPGLAMLRPRPDPFPPTRSEEA